MSDANGCTNIATFDIDNNNPPINVTATTLPNTACIGGTGSINVTVTPPAGPYTYLWSNNAVTQDIGGLTGGTYTVTVSGAGTCSTVASFDVEDDPKLPSLIMDFNPSTCGQPNGDIDLMVSDGVAPYSYLWSNNAVTQDLNNVVPDLYFVTVTGNNGCSSVESGEIPDDIVPITITGVVLPDNSCATNNGRITLTLDPPPPNVTIHWANNSNGSVLNNLAAGTYSVTVSAGGTCTKTATFVVPDESQAPNLSYNSTEATCGLSNGAIDLTVTGGLAPITYAWSNQTNSQDQNNLPPGNYSVTVSSAGGCTATSTISIPSNDLAISISGTPVDNTSCLAPNGSVSVTATPTAPYTYAWSNSGNTPSISNLAPGSYTVTVTTGITCSATASFDVGNNAVAPNLAASAQASICGLNNGTASANPSGGMPPYTFNWSNLGNTDEITGLAAANYSVTVTGANGCSSTASASVVNNNLALNISGTVSDNTSCTTGNGAVNIAVTPAGAYTYAWSNNTNSEDIGNLDGGIYSVTVSAGGSCTVSSLFVVDNNTQDPVISPVVTPAICSNSNGGIDLTVSGGGTPYSYAWSNSTNSEDQVNILSGNYSVTVTAGNGCTADTTLNVANNSSTFSLSGSPTALTNCLTPNGAADLVITPAGSYIIKWSNGEVTEDISGLDYGIYDVSVTDPSGGGCTATASFIIEDNRVYPLATSTVTADVCNLVNGGVDLTVLSGEMPYKYSWSNSQNSEDLTGVAAGVYTVTVSDANSCTVLATATVPENTIGFSLAGTTAPNTICGSSNGTIDLNVTPVGTYTYLWSVNSQITEDVSGLPGGNYSVTVSAGGTCTNVASFTVDDNTLSPVIAEVITPAFCAKSNGSIDVSPGGGQGPYFFKWSNNTSNEDLGNVPAGTYTLTVTGANGCSTVKSYDVPDNVITPGLTGAVTPNSSCVQNNGGVVLDVTPPDTYTFDWSNNQNSQNLVNAAPGDYTVTVSSGGACTAVASFVVPDNTQAVLVSGTPADVLCFNGNSGAIDLSVNGGVQPYQFKWSPAIPGSPEDPTGLIAGNYSVTATDAAGCTGTATFSIAQPTAAVQISCSATGSVTAPGLSDGTGQVDISGGTAPYSVNWSPGGTPSNALAGTFSFSDLGTGNYQVTVTDANGCPADCDFTVALINCSTSVGTMSDVPLSICGTGCVTAFYGVNGQFLDANDVLQFVLHEGNGNQIVNEIARNTQPKFCFDPAKMSYGTTYFISAVAGNNDGSGNVILSDFCTVVSLGTPVVFKEKPEAAIATPGILSCAVKQVPLNGSSNVQGSAFQWAATNGGSIAGNPAQAVITVNAGGLYTLIINHSGCTDTAAVTVVDISNEPLAKISVDPSDILDCTIDEIILSGSAEGTTAVNTVWLLNGTFYTGVNPVPINAPGTYEFVVLDTITACADTAKILINEDLAYPPLFVNPPSVLTCTNKTVTVSGGSPFPGIVFTWLTISVTDTTVVGTGASIVVSTAGTYYLIGSDPNNSCTNFLTTTVTADQTIPVADAGVPFTIACFGETASLNGSGSTGASALKFLWTTTDGSFVSGTGTPTPLINEPGTYFLLVSDPVNGCTDTDQVVIAPEQPTAAVRVNQPPCYGDRGSIVVDSVAGAKPPLKYSLDNGATFTGNNLFSNLVPGVYALFIQDANGCTATATATIVEGTLVEITVEPKVTIALGDTYQINTQVSVPLSQLAQITWTPSTGLSCDSCLNPVASPFTSTQYHLSVSSLGGCEDSAPLLLLVDKEPHVYIPNVFSPNGDGDNDVFMIFADTKSVVKIKSFQIFSRWGELVCERYGFEPNNPAYGWDGKHAGQEMNPAVFVYYAVVEMIDGQEILYEGDVTLKR